MVEAWAQRVVALPQSQQVQTRGYTSSFAIKTIRTARDAIPCCCATAALHALLLPMALRSRSCNLRDDQRLGLLHPSWVAPISQLWYSILPSTFTSKRFTLLGVPTSAFDLPLLTRLGMVLSVGGAVCLLGAVAEGTMLLFWKPKPATSFLSTFNRPVTSPGLARLWARSWHAASQRDYLNMASLMPFSRYEPLQLLYVFFWSGVQHSWMFSRLRTSPTAKITLLTVLTGMLDQGMITFFISQGVGIWIEKAALDAMPAAWKKQRFLIGLARRLWMFTVLVLPGMLFLDSLLRCQLMTKDILDGFGLRALGLMVQGKKY